MLRACLIQTERKILHCTADFLLTEPILVPGYLKPILVPGYLKR